MNTQITLFALPIGDPHHACGLHPADRPQTAACTSSPLPPTIDVSFTPPPPGLALVLMALALAGTSGTRIRFVEDMAASLADPGLPPQDRLGIRNALRFLVAQAILDVKSLAPQMTPGSIALAVAGNMPDRWRDLQLFLDIMRDAIDEAGGTEEGEATGVRFDTVVAAAGLLAFSSVATMDVCDDLGDIIEWHYDSLLDAGLA